MSKMNWEHRNRMQRVYDNPPPGSSKKRRGRKGGAGSQTEYQRHLGHVKLKSKYKSTCALCPKAIHVGNPIWWNPEDKYVVHDECFKKYLG